MVPALAIGFDDVQKRMDQQYRLSEAHDAKLKELETILNKIKTSRLVETAAKLNECKQRHMETAQRLIKVKHAPPKKKEFKLILSVVSEIRSGFAQQGIIHHS